MHSNKMVRALPILWQHWSTMLSKKAKDNKKKTLKNIGVMNITKESVELRFTQWVLIPVSLTLMVQCSTPHHQSMV